MTHVQKISAVFFSIGFTFLLGGSAFASDTTVYNGTGLDFSNWGGSYGVNIMGRASGTGFGSASGNLKTFTITTKSQSDWFDGSPACLWAHTSEGWWSSDCKNLVNHDQTAQSVTWTWTSGPDVSLIDKIYSTQENGGSSAFYVSRSGSDASISVPLASETSYQSWAFAEPEYHNYGAVIATIVSGTSSPSYSVVWNGDSPALIPYFGAYVASASATAIGFVPAGMRIQAVNVTKLSPHINYECSPSPFGVCDSSYFAVQPFSSSGNWRWLAVAWDSSGNYYFSEQQEHLILDDYVVGEVEKAQASASADEWLAIQKGTIPQGSKPSVWGVETWDANDKLNLGVPVLSASSSEILGDVMSGMTIGKNGLLCPDDGSGTSTVCASIQYSMKGLASYPLIGWPMGVFRAFQNAIASASSTAEKNVKYSLPAYDSKISKWSQSEVVLIDSSSSTAGIMGYIGLDNWLEWRSFMSGALWFVFVMSIIRKWQKLVKVLATLT